MPEYDETAGSPDEQSAVATAAGDESVEAANEPDIATAPAVAPEEEYDDHEHRPGDDDVVGELGAEDDDLVEAAAAIRGRIAHADQAELAEAVPTPDVDAAVAQQREAVVAARGDGGGLTALVFAAREGDIESARALLSPLNLLLLVMLLLAGFAAYTGFLVVISL